MYKILTGPRKGEFFLKPQDPITMKRLVEKGIIQEVKEEKSAPETKEEKFVPKTKEIKHRKRVPRNN